MAENRRCCNSCGTPNEEDARFCEGCGASLARVCANCGLAASTTARFCRGCGESLDDRVIAKEAPAAGPVRKTVTVMFADLAGSTSFEEKVDVETAREVIGRYHDLLRSIAQRHRAGTTKYIGDGFMAVWGVPEIGPDDAAHAVDAAVALQEHFVDLAAEVDGAHGVELALRVAVNTGEVVVGAGDADLVGDALNVGARLEAECPRGRVVVGEETWRATRGRCTYESLGQVQVKGRTAPVAVYQWLGRQQETGDTVPFVGRSDEIRRLRAVFDHAAAARAARLVTVTGDPGVGKSRLAAEFTDTVTDARVVEARCVLEATVALAPLVELLRARDLETDVPAGTPERERLLRDLNGLAAGDAGSVEENFWALRRFIEVLADEQPVLLVLDDIQWADTLLLDFIEHLVEWVQEASVLILALARPELRESRPELVTVSGWVSEAIHLGGLDADATAELAAKVLGAARVPDELLRRLPSSTEGNPLFVRELIGMLAHDGVLVERPTGWRLTIDVDAITIPPTIHALLASRLERLDATDRRVLEIASVIGSDFSIGTVRALAGGGAPDVGLSLNRLRRLELAQPGGTYAGDDPLWRFHHVLIRDVAYRRLLKSDRADLHERLADWVAAGGAGVAFDVDEMVARHLEAAHRYRLDLGIDDEHTGDLGRRAARHYVASARRALDRDELISAGTQAARGAALTTADAAIRAELLLIGCESFLSTGDVTAGAPLVEDLEHLADEALLPWATCYRCQFVIYTDPARLPEVDALLQGAIDEFGRRRDHAGLAKAHRVRAGARARLGRIGDCEADLFEALIAARQSGDHRQITAALGAAPGAALWGPSPVPKAGGRCLDVVRMQRMTTAAPSLEATSLRCLAVLELLRGRPDKARTMLADARQVVADLGLRHGLMETELFAGIIESMEGDPVAAEPHFRTALEGLDALGVGADAGQAAALLARSVLAQGRIDEADRHASESERLAGRNLKSAIAWRAVRAEILSAQGRHDDASAMANEAVVVAADTDLVLDHADACLTLSRVLQAAGDAKGASAARDNAKALYAAKEVTSAITRVNAQDISAPTTSAKTTTSSRLRMSNRATETFTAVVEAMKAWNVDAAAAHFSDRLSYDDRRPLSGDPIENRAGARAALERLGEQYRHFESRVLAIRGEYLALSHVRWSDDAGNETTGLIVAEVDGDGQIVYQGRFDEDFDAAYRELEGRYYLGEGAAFAEGGAAGTEWALALNRNDFDAMFEEFMTSDFRIMNRSRSAFPDRSAAEYRTSLEELAAMVVSSQSWVSAISWLSPTCYVARCERDALGAESEHYTWSFIITFEVRDGRIASMCEFDADDEVAAFAYAEDRLSAGASRLVVSNRASRTADVAFRALQRHDLDIVATFSTKSTFIYDDRRRLSGDSIDDSVGLRAASRRILEQYPYSEWRTLAVRGEQLELRWQRLWDDAGNEATTFNVLEIDEHEQLVYFGRFDDDDFEGAYRELDRRYYAGEGAAFIEGGAVATESMMAMNRGDFDLMFGASGTQQPTFDNRSRSLFPNRSAVEVRAGFEQLDAMVASMRSWLSVVRWLSPSVAVGRFEREAFGQDDEVYAWARINVTEISDGRVAAICQFEVDDEESAFAYAEERLREATSRLAVTNRASVVGRALVAALNAGNIDAAVAAHAERLEYDDRRRLSAYPIEGRAEVRRAIERTCRQYTRFDTRALAVRGERLGLTTIRRSDDAANETVNFNVFEVDEDGLITYQGFFDEDDFEGAYRELDKRYYASEGAASAGNGDPSTEWACALNTGDFDRLVDLSWPDMRVENWTRSAFPSRSVSELRASFGDLDAMVDSSLTWLSVVRWLSPNWAISRFERQATGRDGEDYAWTKLVVAEVRDGRYASMCEFELDDEEAAFAYAEERLRATASRLAVTNPASEKIEIALSALRAGDADGMVAGFSNSFVYDDRRRLSGNPVVDVDAYRASVTLAIEQYNHFEWRTMAVRGERLVLVWSRMYTDADYESTHLHVHEVDGDGHILCEIRFDGDDFEGAYRELERRYRAGEGAPIAEAAATLAEYPVAFMKGDIDGLFERFAVAGLLVEDRSRSLFGDRSAADFRTTYDDLSARVVELRVWHAAVCWLSPTLVVARFEQDAIGRDGEQYAWTHIDVAEIHAGQFASVCLFDIDDEESAFAYAQERLRAAARRLAVTNRASATSDSAYRALQSRDVEAVVASYSDRCVFEDRRRLSGNPIDGIAGLSTNIQRLVTQCIRFEWRTLAVRGERLVLVSSHASSEAGFEASHLFVCEVSDGLIIYQCTFDEEDFEGAYRELERRYYTEEGAAFAEAGAAATQSIVALNRGDFDQAFGELSSPEMRFENRSRVPFPTRSASEMRASSRELSAMVASWRTWGSSVCWLSPTWGVARLEREAAGADGERFAWTWLQAFEVRDGRIASLCFFDLEDEEAAFAYAEERMRSAISRLAVTNQSCDFLPGFIAALHDKDLDGSLSAFSKEFVYDDRRRLSGDPIVGREAMRRAVERIFEQYCDFELRVLAVRGNHLNLLWSRWTDEHGNESTTLYVNETDSEGRVFYHGRFDEDDFEGAYRELERRYYTGEGAEFAGAGTTLSECIIALNRGDFGRVFNELTAPDFRIENRSRSGFGERGVAAFRASFEELYSMVGSVRNWQPAVHWVSPTVVVVRYEREAVGADGETYRWAFLDVAEVRDGRLAWGCQFEVDDEEAAFACAEERVRATASRLMVANPASRIWSSVGEAMRARDADGAAALFADSYVYDDRWGMAGNPPSDVRTACAEILEQYSRFDGETLAVRGESLQLSRTHWSNHAGFETEYLHVVETGDDGRIHYYGRFAPDDFESAYRELENRYYAREGAAFADAGRVSVEYATAVNRGDLDRTFAELTAHDFRIENRSRSIFGDRSAADFEASLSELNTMVAATKMWDSAVCWVSPVCCIARSERVAVGHEDERYAWTHVTVAEIRDGRFASVCLFDLDAEDAAFAYAEERVRAAGGRLSLSTLASRTFEKGLRALQSRDTDAAVAFYVAGYEYDDRRRFGGSPPRDLRTANEQILKQYSSFEGRTLAVRGERLHLGWTRWSNESGFETCYLLVHEVDENGRFVYEGRFDEEDFDAAYRELTRRYCAGEGSAVAEGAAFTAEYLIGVNRREWDRVFGELTDPAMHVVSRSSSGFPDRSAAELRASYEDLGALVASMRSWHSTEHWLSATVVVTRHEREAVGRDGERYEWSRLVVGEFRDGRAIHMCEFDLDDEDAAYAYAEERMQATASRLVVTNRATKTFESQWKALQGRDIDAAVAHFAEPMVYDDRRRLQGNPLGDTRTALERILKDYTSFEGRTLAVRGETLHLGLMRWSNEAGFEACYLMVQEVDEAGKVGYHGRFDEDDFDAAYRELDRRYYTGEGVTSAEAGSTQTEWLTAFNRGDLDRVFGELTAPQMRFKMRSSSAFPDSSMAEARAAIEDFIAMVDSTRTWHSAVCWMSATCCVTRNEREAIGHDGEQYTWTRLSVVEYRDGRMTSECEFDLGQEDEAFAYAEELVRATPSRLAVTNRAKQAWDALDRLAHARDFDGLAACFSPSLVNEDHRRWWSGWAIGDMRTVAERVAEQYTRLEMRSLAVRGDRLHFGWTRYVNDSEFESTAFWVIEVDDDGLINYLSRFDDDAFEDAYREFEQRYYAGEGAAFAAAGVIATEFSIAVGQGDFDRVFGELFSPDFHVENRSRSALSDRSAAGMRAGVEALRGIVESWRTWNSATCWLSPTCGVCRSERIGTGRDGEKYVWSDLVVFVIRDGRAQSACMFELDDEEAAFAYAAERMRPADGTNVEA